MVGLGDDDPVILCVLDTVTETVGLAVKRWLVGIGERDSVMMVLLENDTSVLTV